MTLVKDETDLPWKDHPQIDYWVEEQIWGHRIWDAQTPWLIFLEFLGIADSALKKGELLDEQGKHYPLNFRPHRRMMLRNILYNNQIMPYVLDRFQDNGRAWREWQTWMQENSRGIVDRDFSYLIDRFDSFAEFSKLVMMLRSATVESESNRRWSSRFLFPFGKECLYEDVRVTASGSPSREYINFGRTGELLYLMLCRSSQAASIRPHLNQVVSSSNPWNVLVGLLQNDDADEADTKGQSFLPYKQHTSFDLLGSDILHVFQLGLPRFDGYPHLVLLSTLHLLLYQLNVAWEIVGGRKPYFVCEIVAPRKTQVRELSITSFQANSQLSLNAVHEYVDRIGKTDEWAQAKIASDAFPRCTSILVREVAWPRDDGDYDGEADPDTMLKSLKRRAMAKHGQHLGGVHRSYGRAVGLISKRGTNKMRYAPNDALLKALILANVSDRMEFKEFLSLLFERYGLVIGEREAKQVMDEGDFDPKAFQSNAIRLEQRMSSLGMVRRLSDACAYVLNPYAEMTR